MISDVHVCIFTWCGFTLFQLDNLLCWLIRRQSLCASAISATQTLLSGIITHFFHRADTKLFFRRQLTLPLCRMQHRNLRRVFWLLLLFPSHFHQVRQKTATPSPPPPPPLRRERWQSPNRRSKPDEQGNCFISVRLMLSSASLRLVPTAASQTQWTKRKYHHLYLAQRLRWDTAIPCGRRTPIHSRNPVLVPQCVSCPLLPLSCPFLAKKRQHSKHPSPLTLLLRGASRLRALVGGVLGEKKKKKKKKRRQREDPESSRDLSSFLLFLRSHTLLNGRMRGDVRAAVAVAECVFMCVFSPLLSPALPPTLPSPLPLLVSLFSLRPRLRLRQAVLSRWPRRVQRHLRMLLRWWRRRLGVGGGGLGGGD